MSAKKKVKKQKVETASGTERTVHHDIVLGFLLVILAVIIYVIRIRFLDVPMERDEGDYGLAGKLILEGAKPYIDVFEQKPPGLFYSYAIVEAIFGTTVQGLKTGFIFVNIATVALLAYALRYFLSPLAGIIGACTFAILSLNPFASGFAVQAEHLLVLYVAISFFFLGLYKKTGRLPALIIAGAMVAWSATIKQNGIFFIAAFTIGITAIHLSRQKWDGKQLLKEYLHFGAGGVGMAILVFLAMFILGVWDEFLFWSISFPREFYISKISLNQGIKFFQIFYENISSFDQWIWYSSFAGLVAIYFSRIARPIKVWISILYLLAFFSICPGLRFYGHYWIQWFFGISIVLGGLAFTLDEVLQNRVSGLVSNSIILLAFIVSATLSLSNNKEYYLNPDAEGIMNQVYGDNPFTESKKIAAFINSKNPDLENDQLLVLGSEPQILLETGMKSPTPHTFVMFMVGAHPAGKIWQAEYEEMMNRKEAKYIVFVGHPFSWLATGEGATQFVTRLYSILNANYKIIGIADILSVEQTIYKWDDEAANYQPKSPKNVLVYERK